MTKADFVNAISEKLGLKKADIANVLDETFTLIGDTLADGEKCTFVGFGVFEPKERAAREGRNPQNPTEVIKIPARRVATFKPGKELKEKVANAKKKKK